MNAPHHGGSSLLHRIAMGSGKLKTLWVRGSTGVSMRFDWAVLILGPAAIGYFSVLQGQDINWDLQNYHLYNPYSYWNDRLLVDLAPAGVQSYYNPYLDALYFWAVSLWSPKFVGFVLGTIHGLSFVFLYAICRQVLEGHPSARAKSLFLTVSGVLSLGFLSQVGTVTHDNLVAVFLLASLWLLISSNDSADRNPDALGAAAKTICAGILAGVANGLKLTSAVYSPALCLAILALGPPWRARLKSGLLFGACVLVGLAVSDGLWMFRIWSHFDNPVFPMFNHIFQAELFAAVPTLDERFLPGTMIETLFYPVVFTLNPSRVSEMPYYQISWLCAFVAVTSLLVVLIVKAFRKSPARNGLNSRERFLLAFFCLGYLVWLNLFGVYRYLVPLEVLVPLVLFVAWRYFFRTRHVWGAGLLLVGITVFNLSGGIPDWRHAEWADQVYRVEPGRLSEPPEPAVVYLAGLPLAWIVPALDIDAPFVQLLPQLPPPDAYWRRANVLVEGRQGERFVVLATQDDALMEDTASSLKNLGLRMNCGADRFLVGYLGASRFEYKYCEVEPASTQ